MHKYELNYEHMGIPQTVFGEAIERKDAHDLLMDLKLGDKGGQIPGTHSIKDSLALLRLTNARVTWL